MRSRRRSKGSVPWKCSRTQLRLLREEKAELEARVSALEHGVRELPTLERDLLFQADRTDVLESALEPYGTVS